MIEIKAACAACGSTDIVSFDHIIATCRVQAWSRNEAGGLVPEFGGESDVFWDTQEPVYEKMPYQCGDCGEMLGADDLIVTECEDDEEEEWTTTTVISTRAAR